MLIQESINEWTGRVTEAEFETVGMRDRAKMITFIKRDRTRKTLARENRVQQIIKGMFAQFVRPLIEF